MYFVYNLHTHTHKNIPSSQCSPHVVKYTFVVPKFNERRFLNDVTKPNTQLESISTVKPYVLQTFVLIDFSPSLHLNL